MAKILIATEKPFSKVAVDGIKKVADEAGMELALLVPLSYIQSEGESLKLKSGFPENTRYASIRRDL